MMEATEARIELARVFEVYPSYRDMLERMPEGRGSKTLDAWCSMLVGCESNDVKFVISLICSGDMEPTEKYEKPDKLARNIRIAANERRSVRNAKRRQLAEYHQEIERAPDDSITRFMMAMRESRRLGILVREGDLEKVENDRRVAVLQSWSTNGGETPEWMQS